MSKPKTEICRCIPPEYEDCNNRYGWLCAIINEDVTEGQKCPFYKSVKDTSPEDMQDYHKWRLKAEEREKNGKYE